MHKKIFRSAKMRTMQRGVNTDTYGSTSTSIAILPRQLPSIYALSSLQYNMPNKYSYHPFCFNIKAGAEEHQMLLETSYFTKNSIVFNEDQKDYSNQNRYTGYFTGAFAFLPITYMRYEFSSSDFLQAANFNGFIYLFRFFDDTQCGCDVQNFISKYRVGKLVPCDPKTTNPGAIILVTRVSEINTISSNKSSAETFNMTRPLSNAILDYCEKNNTTPKQIFTNATAAILTAEVEKNVNDFFDEELNRYYW